MGTGPREDIWAVIRKLEGSFFGAKTRTLTAHVLELFEIHERQWDLETLCREPAASLSSLGSLKREIDRSNAKRIAVICRVDSLLGSRNAAPSQRLQLVFW